MTDDVTLASGTLIEHYDSNGVWQRVPRVTSTGDTGSLAEAKDKTTLEDGIKRFGSGLREGGDKNFKGQRIPVQIAGTEHFTDRDLQEAWITRCKAEEEMQMRITFPNFERGMFTFKSLGYLVDDATAEDWMMFSVNGKQNSLVDWSTAPLLTAVAVNGTGAIATGANEQLTVANTPADAFYRVNQDVWTSADPAVVTVTKWGYITGVSAGTAEVSVIRKTGDGTTVTALLEIVVS